MGSIFKGSSTQHLGLLQDTVQTPEFGPAGYGVGQDVSGLFVAAQTIQSDPPPKTFKLAEPLDRRKP